ncbi:MAG: hypothetical protein JST68_19355 [Bacteroidetes bacterium]|nr:hypothetical protein [Bacteroidota bacterium]
MTKQVLLGFLLGLVGYYGAYAQDYHAVEGSPFAGAMGVSNNPASILSTPYKWDFTILSTQLKNSTNAIKFGNYSYLSHPDTIAYKWTPGNIRRFASVNYNLHLFNARFLLGRKQAISFGLNLKSYTTVRTGLTNYNDTLKDMNDFFSINGPNTVYEAQVASSTWMELYATYSRTIWDDGFGRLNAGVTLKGMRGLSGAFAQLRNGGINRNALPTGETLYNLLAGNFRYGYSANYDYWHDNQSTSKNLSDFLGHSQGGVAMDLGVEYLVKTQALKAPDDDDDDYWDYEWKLGASLLDIGRNNYIYGTQSRSASTPKSNVTDVDLNKKFDNTGSFAEFNDSLSTIVDDFQTLTGQFKIWNPVRLVLNVDRPLQDHFAINANLTLNLGGNNKGKTFYTKEMTLLAVTPRWETRSLGGYLPLTVTTDGKVWLGGAFKAGPVIFGVHNWATVFSKTKAQNGGFYLSFVVRPGKHKGGFKQKEDKMYTCPKD